MTDSEQPTFRNPAGNKADLSEDEKSSAAVRASGTACKNSCTHATADQEVSVKALAEELTDVADTTQVFGSETSSVEGHTYLLFQVSSFTGAHTTVDPKGFDVETMMSRFAQKDHSAALSARLPSLSLVMKCGPGEGEDPFADV